MKYLFLDNFRGFQRTVLPINRVTFLVGENSTGKSTVLEALNLLSSIRFWTSQEFNTEEKYLGNFENIVSKSSKSRNSFHIGWAQTKDDYSQNESRRYAVCMEFKSLKERPFVHRAIYVDDDINVRYKITNNEIRYISSKSNIFDAGKRENISHFFNNWKENKHSLKKGYNRIRITNRNPRGSLRILDSIIDEEKGSSRSPRYLIRKYLAPNYETNFWWIAPIRSKPQRIYDIGERQFSPEGTHTPFLVRDIINNKQKKKEFKRFIKKIGRSSGLFEGINIESLGDPKSYTSPFKISVSLEKSDIGINDVGYGISQILPVIVEVFYRRENSWYAIQQPEVHLHPKARASLGDLFFERACSDQKTFLVETHSDYIVDRFRYNYKENNVDFDAQVLFFERKNGFNQSHVLPLDGKGRLPDNPPDSYREFFVEERLKTLEI